jgi:hypothetical protein
MSRNPRVAAYLVAGAISLWFSYDLMRKPVQVSDSLIELLDVQASQSLYATFGAHTPRGPFLRPLRQVQIKALFDAAQGHYWLVFRGFHGLLLSAALFLFVRALRVGTWIDFAAAVFALTVLTGLHTFRGTVQEAFPINHFLEIVVFCLVALNLAQSRGGWWIDVAAAATFVIASLTLESGVLVWVVAVAAWASGMRGISRRGLIGMTMLLAAYLWFRLFYLQMGSPGLEGRDSGWGTTMLLSDEIERRFGADPTWFYVYNVVTSVLSVLFSDPERGVFQTARAWMQGGTLPRLYLSTVSSIITTVMIAWVAVALARGRARMLPASAGFLVIFPIVLIANCIMAYPYAKREIITVAGTFYALAAFAAAQYTIDGFRQPRSRLVHIAMCVILGGVAAAWAFRSAGVHHMIQTQAFRERLEWARLDPDRLAARSYRSDDSARALAVQLRQAALDMRIANPSRLPSWADRWWGE